MVRIAIAIIAALAFMCVAAGSAQAQTAERPNTADCKRLYGGATFTPLIRRSWAERKWRDATPVTKRQSKRIENHRRCPKATSTWRYFLKAAERQRHQFKSHRKKKLAQQAQQNAYGDIDPPGEAYLYDLRMCESGGNYGAVSPDGTYRGAYQFDYSTWASVGGSGDPAAASPAEQDYRAAALYRSRGSSPWPVCG